MYLRTLAPAFTLLAATAARPLCTDDASSVAKSLATKAAAIKPIIHEVDIASTVIDVTTVIVYETVTAGAPLPTDSSPSSPVVDTAPSTSLLPPAPPVSTPQSTAVVVPSRHHHVSSSEASPPSTTTAAQVISSASPTSAPEEAPTTSSEDSSPSPSTPTEAPPTSSANSSPSPTISTNPSSPPAATSNPSKRGIIANPIPGVVSPFTAYPKISWDMNWWHGPPPSQPDDWLFIPQLTHLTPDQYWPHADFRTNVSEFPYIASFLEPNGQVSIDDAVASWRTNLEPLAASHTLIPPMVGQNGLSWLQNFTEACTGCTLDKGPIAFTIYAGANPGGVGDFKNHVSQFAAAYPGRELWAANIGVLGDANDTATEWLMRELVAYLDEEPAVTRYAWNGAQSFWDEDSGALTPLAELYATL